MSDGDKLVLEQAVDQQDLSVPFQQKRYQEITDQNASNGAFTGQITFDLANLSSMNQWANLSEAYINFPVKFSIKNISGAARTPHADVKLDAFSMCPKGGWHSFVSSVSLTIGSTNIQSANIYQNVQTSFKMLSEWSHDELQKYGSTLGVAIDDYKIDAANNNTLVGIENVSNDLLFKSRRGLVVSDPTVNDGFEERAYACNSGHQTANSAANAILGSNGAALGKNTSQFSTAAIPDQSDAYVCFALATIRLKDISDAVGKLPPMKSIKGMLTINYNSAYTDVACTTSSTGSVYVETAVSTSALYGHSMPAMIRGDWSGKTTSDVSSIWRIQAEVSAVKSANLTTASPPQTNARLYVPVYVASPEVDRMLSMKKTIRYHERYQTTLTVEAGSSYSGSISAGIQNPRRLTLSGYFVADPKGKFAANSVLPQPLLSPFSHEGYGTSPLAAIRDWQVELSGRPIFQQPYNQDFHAFIEEFASCGLNSGLTHELGSGLLSQRLWSQLYRYYTCDLSRRISSDDGSTVSVNTSFTNATDLRMLVIANLEHEKEITIDTQFGLISQGL